MAESKILWKWVAEFVAGQHGRPNMLIALLFGLAFQSVSEEKRFLGGITFTARRRLRVSVALLGARISLDLLADLYPILILGTHKDRVLGPVYLGLIVTAVSATIAVGLLVGKSLEEDGALPSSPEDQLPYVGHLPQLPLLRVCPETNIRNGT